jgi:proteasome-associated ATPase
MASRDDSVHSGRHDEERQALTTQISFLEEEVAALRSRLADSPRQTHLLEQRLREAESNLSSITGQNERLAATLREARDQIIALKEEVDRLAQPPSGFGIFLQATDDGTADVFTGGLQDARERQPERLARGAAAWSGSGAQRGAQRRHSAGL